MNKLILAATVALVSTVAASSAFAGCHDTYSYDTYSSDYSTTYTPTYSGGYSSGY